MNAPLEWTSPNCAVQHGLFLAFAPSEARTTTTTSDVRAICQQS